MTIELAYCCWGLSGYDETILDHIARARIPWMDIRPADFTHPGGRRHMREVGVQESCMGISFGIPSGTCAGQRGPERAHDRGALLRVVDPARQQVGARNRIRRAVPGHERGGAGALHAVAHCALPTTPPALDVRIAIEHFPHTALPTIAATLAYLRELAHPNLYLLLDIGHAQMSDEDAPAAIADAGPLLGYVHLDDNDGVGDLHLALLDGVLTEASLRATFDALQEHGYSGRASLELHPGLRRPGGRHAAE